MIRLLFFVFAISLACASVAQTKDSVSEYYRYQSKEFSFSMLCPKKWEVTENNNDAGSYFLRIAARGACGPGAVSNEVTMFVAPPSVVPVQPTALTATVASGIVTLQWTAPGSGAAPTSYSIEVGTAPSLSNVLVLNTGTTATATSGPVPPGRYYMRVRTRAGTRVSPPSNEVMIDVP